MANAVRLADSAQSMKLDWSKLNLEERALVWDELARRQKRRAQEDDEEYAERQSRIAKAMRAGRRWPRRSAGEIVELAHRLEVSAYSLLIGGSLGLTIFFAKHALATRPSAFRMLASVQDYVEFRVADGKKYDVARFECRLPPHLRASVNVLTQAQASIVKHEIAYAFKVGPARQQRLLEDMEAAGREIVTQWPAVGRVMQGPLPTTLIVKPALAQEEETPSPDFDFDIEAVIPGATR